MRAALRAHAPRHAGRPARQGMYSPTQNTICFFLNQIQYVLQGQPWLIWQALIHTLPQTDFQTTSTFGRSANQKQYAPVAGRWKNHGNASRRRRRLKKRWQHIPLGGGDDDTPDVQRIKLKPVVSKATIQRASRCRYRGAFVDDHIIMTVTDVLQKSLEEQLGHESFSVRAGSQRHAGGYVLRLTKCNLFFNDNTICFTRPTMTNFTGKKLAEACSRFYLYTLGEGAIPTG